MTVREVLMAAGHPDARLLLCHVLGCERMALIADPARLLTDEQLHLFNSLLERRLKGEPVAKIMGIKEFWGLPFKVTTDTLDPRPDTETLVEAVLKYGGAKRILDLGTGSGCIILSILKECPDAKGVAVDISPAALEIARHNAKQLGLAGRVDLILSDWDEGVQGQFDVIVSNPPYITQAEYDQLDHEVKAYDPQTALLAGDDGLDCYRKIAPIIYNRLAESGFFAIEIGAGQGESVQQILTGNKLEVANVYKDLAGLDRVIVGRRENSNKDINK